MQKGKRINKKYSPEYKINVIQDMRNNHLGYSETVRKYWGNDTIVQHHKSQLKLWEHIYLEKGAERFMVERRGRTNKAENPKIGRPLKLDKKVEGNLVAENQRLRMENEYLKKLHALVQERIQRKN